MGSEWTELLLDSQFETNRTGVANQPDILVLKEGSWFDVATVKKHDKLIKHFDGTHMNNMDTQEEPAQWMTQGFKTKLNSSWNKASL